MRVKKFPLAQAIDQILVHNHVGPDGRRVIRKGHRLTAADLPVLQSLVTEQVYTAVLEPDDVDENEAARRIGQLLTGNNLNVSPAVTGRVNLTAAVAGVLKINVDALLALNDTEGITLAVLPNNTVVAPKMVIGTIKIIPYAVPLTRLQAVEHLIGAQNSLIAVNPFVMRQAVLITTGSEAGRKKVVRSFTPALHNRLTAYSVTLIEGPSVPENEADISQALRHVLRSGAEMVLIAGETSIMDVDDITPQAIKAVGGRIIHYGMPVEPGNLMLLAHKGDIPIVGVPGCARSKKFNVVDMVLPRLVAGEQLTRRDLVALGHGGLLQ
jgi:molybdenum cofactor cytidylyltransferase